jgi:hypothetical protein
METCYMNLGSADTPKHCTNKAIYHYRMDRKLSDTFLCKEHSKSADESTIVKRHLVKKERLTQ